MFQRTSIHLRRTHNKYIRKKPTNPINQNKNDTFLKRYKSTSWHDKNLSKRFKSSSAAPPSSTPSSAAFSEAMAQHEEEENEDLFDYDSDDIYNIYNDYTNTTDDIDTNNNNNNTQQDNHYFQQDTKESLDHFNHHHHQNNPISKEEKKGEKTARNIIEKLRGKRLMRVDRYKMEELAYLSNETEYFGLSKVASQLREAIIKKYGEEHINDSTVDDYEQQLASEFELMRDNALRQIQSFAEQQEFDVINNETRHDVTSLIATWWKPLLAKVKREVEAIMNGEKGQDRSAYGVYFATLKPEVITLCALQTLLNTVITAEGEDSSTGHKLVTVALSMGKAIENEIIRESLIQSGKRWINETVRKQQEEDFYTDHGIEYDNDGNIIGSTKMIFNNTNNNNNSIDGISGNSSSNSIQGDDGDENNKYNKKRKTTNVSNGNDLNALFDHMQQNDRFRSTQIPRSEEKLIEASKRMLKHQEAWSPRTHVKVGSALLKLMLESLTVSMRLDDERLDEYIYFEKYLLEKPNWMKKYKQGVTKNNNNGNDIRDDDDDDDRVEISTNLLPEDDEHNNNNDDELAIEHLNIINRLNNGYHMRGKMYQGNKTGVKIYSDIPEEIFHDEIRRVPALYHTYYCKDGKRVGVIRLHPKVFDDLRSLNNILNLNQAKYKPMVVPPLPWKSSTKGGYLALPSKLVRVNQNSVTDVELDSSDLTLLYDGLNALAAVPWMINNNVLSEVEKVWSKDLTQDFAGLPATSGTLPSIPLLTGNFEEDKDKIINHRRLIYSALKKSSESHSMQCDTNLKINTALAHKYDEKIYFPQNVDFRGRVYPITPNFNHLGNDLSRSLLQFANKKPLGDRGFHWLKVHAANLFGFDKASFDDRAKYIEDRMEDLIDCAENPLNGKQWWLEADYPWQALGAAKEIYAAIRHEGGIETYMTGLPVHQDGSCNGLQHYAALGRDYDGAVAVNLIPSDKPQDVYSRVLDIVLRTVKEDQDNEEDPEIQYLAQKVYDIIDRKVVKQTVMTSVYGVTFVGAREQIGNRIREKVTKNKLDPMLYDYDFQYKLSIYLARITLDSIGELFSNAKGIMTWLAQVADVVAAENEAVSWISPLGLPVVQPYRRNQTKTISTVLQSIQITDAETYLPVNKRKQSSAFPPNFVHSLDSTHMIMTAITCRSAGLDFAAVHDSYWTHPGDVEQMNVHLRESFIDLYDTRDILGELEYSLKVRFPHIDIPEIPERGTLDMNEVKNSDYFFS